MNWLWATAYSCLSLVLMESCRTLTAQLFIRELGSIAVPLLQQQFYHWALSCVKVPARSGREALYLSSVSLRPLCERRKFLHDNMVEIRNRIMFSEMKQVTVSEVPLLGRDLMV